MMILYVKINQIEDSLQFIGRWVFFQGYNVFSLLSFDIVVVNFLLPKPKWWEKSLNKLSCQWIAKLTLHVYTVFLQSWQGITQYETEEWLSV